MRWVLDLIGVLFIILSIPLILFPKASKDRINHFVKRKKRKIIRYIIVLFGILFIFLSGASNMPWFVALLGCLAVLKGLSLILLSKNTSELIINWWITSSYVFYRIWGINALILGIIFIALA